MDIESINTPVDLARWIAVTFRPEPDPGADVAGEYALVGCPALTFASGWALDRGICEGVPSMDAHMQKTACRSIAMELKAQMLDPHPGRRFYLRRSVSVDYSPVANTDETVWSTKVSLRMGLLP